MAFQHKDIVNGLERDLQRMCVVVAIFQNDLYCAQVGENEARRSICRCRRCVGSESKNTQDRGYEWGVIREFVEHGAIRAVGHGSK